MYEIKSLKTKNNSKPYYKVVFEYMIGDADGHTSEELKLDVSEFNEDAQNALHVIQKFVELDILGLFDDEYLNEALERELITQKEYNILKSEIDGDGYFSDCIQALDEYLVYIIENVNITYIDEERIEHEVVWKD